MSAIYGGNWRANGGVHSGFESTAQMNFPKSQFLLLVVTALLSLPEVSTVAFAHEETPPSQVRFDFRQSESLAPWLSWAPSNPVSDGVEIRLPGRVDENHLDGIGPIYLIAHLPMSRFLMRSKSCDLRDAEIALEVRTKDLDLAGGRVCWWIVSEIPKKISDPVYPWQQTNWACTGRVVALAADSGEQAQVYKTVLSPDPSLWTYAGTNDTLAWAGRYREFPLARSLASVDATLHLVVTGCDPSRMPSGTVTLRSIEIRLAQPTVCPTAAEIEGLLVAGDWVAARPLLERAAASGQSGAAFHLGNALKFGLGGPIDYHRAVSYFAAAADDEPAAAVEQADLLMKGLGVVQDYDAAIRLLSRERVRQLPRAKYLSGLLHWRGKGMPVDLAGARELLESAATDGQYNAIIPAGFVCMDLGDMEQAYRWLALAKSRYAAQFGSMMSFVERPIEMLSARIPKQRRDSLDSDVASWPTRQFSASKHPE